MPDAIALSDSAFKRTAAAVRKVESLTKRPKTQHKKRPIGPDYRFFQVMSAGPSAESDFTDERYWLQLVELTNSDSDPTSKLEFDLIPDTDDRYLYASGTNLSEWMGETHNLAADSIVPVFTAYAVASIEIARRFFNFPT